MFKKLKEKLIALTVAFEKAEVAALDKEEAIDDALVKEIEELHEKADALEAKIRAKLAVNEGTPTETSSGESSAVPEAAKS